MNADQQPELANTTYNQQKQCLIPIANRPDLVFTKGQGDFLYTEDGTPYLDMMQGWAVNTLGHCPEVIQNCLAEQASQLINPGPAFYNQPMLTLASSLCENSCFDQVFFANSGAEANEGAIKLARKWGKKHKQGAFKIITFNNAFHGRTLATMSATGKPSFAPLFEPKVDGFTKVPFNDLDAVTAAIDTSTCAIMLELIQGEAGIIKADKSFVKALAQLCQQHNLLLIVDEVQTGVGRTGKLFAYEHYGITPAIMTLGKGLGGGVPISALLIQQAISCFEPGDQGGTFNGNPLMCSVANTVLDQVCSHGFLEQLNKNSHYLRSQLEHLSAQFGLGEVRGEGLLLALDTQDYDAQAIALQAQQQQLLINAPRSDCLRFMPALNVSHATLQQSCNILAGIFNAITHQEVAVNATS